MWRLILVCYAGSLALYAPANASESWTQEEEVQAVTVRMHWVSTAELLAAARDVGRRPQAEALAFSVLRKNIETGTYTCDIYMLKRPDRTWDRPTLSLGHELAHCLGFVHH
jgi:hypothetical protein